MFSSAEANPLALFIARKKPSDDRPPCLEKSPPRRGGIYLTENATSPFHAEPRHHSRTVGAAGRADRFSLDVGAIPQLTLAA
jgi:hypothetical protein